MIMPCYLHIFLNSINDFWKVVKQLIMMNVSIDLRLQELKGKFRKLTKFGGRPTSEHSNNR